MKQFSDLGGGMDFIPSQSLLQRHAPLRPVPGCNEIRVHQAWNFYDLWQAWEEETGQVQGIPYWAAVWPGAMVLVCYMLGRAMVASKRVLDLGCGGAVAGISAARAGAQEVIVNDIDPIALAVAKRNAQANGVNLRFDANDLTKAGCLYSPDVVLAADLFYERSSSGRLLRFLRKVQREGARVFIADSDRPFAPRKAIRTLWKKRVSVNLDLEGTEKRAVRLLELL
jgi:predicted nicotinamide N-methyase